MADQRALYESISRRGIEGAGAGSARRQRVVIFALVGVFLAIAVATQFMNTGSVQHPLVVEHWQSADAH